MRMTIKINNGRRDFGGYDMLYGLVRCDLSERVPAVIRPQQFRLALAAAAALLAAAIRKGVLAVVVLVLILVVVSAERLESDRGAGVGVAGLPTKPPI